MKSHSVSSAVSNKILAMWTVKNLQTNLSQTRLVADEDHLQIARKLEGLCVLFKELLFNL
jgi:hypothetical protein